MSDKSIPEKKDSNKKKKRGIIAAVCVVIIIAGAALSGFYFFPDKFGDAVKSVLSAMFDDAAEQTEEVAAAEPSLKIYSPQSPAKKA